MVEVATGVAGDVEAGAAGDVGEVGARNLTILFRHEDSYFHSS